MKAAPNANGTPPGYAQPETCFSCGSDDRMSITRAADDRKYWVCDHCGQHHAAESEPPLAPDIATANAEWLNPLSLARLRHTGRIARKLLAAAPRG